MEIKDLELSNIPTSKINVTTIHNQKNNPNKTTPPPNPPPHLARRGNKTLLIDIDIGAGTIQYIFKLKSEDIKTSTNDILLGEQILKKGLASSTSIPNLDVLISKENVHIGKGMLKLIKSIQESAFFRLIELINSAKKLGYRYAVIDCTPGWKLESLYALCVSDISIFIVRPSTFSFEGAKYMLTNMYKEVDLVSLKKSNASTYFIFNQTPMEEDQGVNEILEKWKNELIEIYKPKKLEFLGKIPYIDKINNGVIKGSYIVEEGSEIHKIIKKMTDKITQQK